MGSEEVMTDLGIGIESPVCGWTSASKVHGFQESLKFSCVVGEGAEADASVEEWVGGAGACQRK